MSSIQQVLNKWRPGDQAWTPITRIRQGIHGTNENPPQTPKAARYSSPPLLLLETEEVGKDWKGVGCRRVLGVQKGTEAHGHCVGLWGVPGLGPGAAPPFHHPPSLDVPKAGLPIPPGPGAESSEAAAGSTSYPGGSRRGCDAPGTGKQLHTPWSGRSRNSCCSRQGCGAAG